jgi:hypothetical protein
MFSSRLRFTSAIMACAAIGALTACSTGGTPAALTQTPSMPPPSQLLATVKSAALGASAVHIKGSGTDSGSKVSMDLQLNKDSTAGTIGEGGTNVTVKYVDKVMYVELTKDLLTSQGANPNSPQTQAIENKWVPSTSQLASGMASALQPMTGYSSFVGGLFGSLPNETPKQTGTDTVNGTPVTVYTFQDGSKADVATSAPHFLLRLIAPKSEGGELDFTGWNQTVTVAKPAASEIYNGPGA